MFLLSKSENEETITALITTFRKWFMLSTDLLFPRVISFCTDHCWAIHNALKTVFPDAQATECYPHTCRGVAKYKYNSPQKKLFTQQCIKHLHLASSLNIFNLLAEKTCQVLCENNEFDVCNTLESTYLNKKWSCFWFGASGHAGHLSNQNL